ESVWAKEEPDGRFVLDNIPFFATQATLGDVVAATLEDGCLRYSATLERSGNSLIRVVCFRGTDPMEVRGLLEEVGCSTELFALYSLVAVNVPPSVNLEDVEAALRRGVEDGRWGYEEPLLMQ